MHLDDTAHILGSADFFAICNLEQRRMLAFASDRLLLSSGDTLFIEGEITPGAYVLISGELVSKSKSDKNAQPVEIVQAGTVIGQLALITEHPRRVTITCQADAEVLLVPRSAFSKLMQQFPEVAVKAVQMIKTDVGAYVNSLKEAGQKSGF